MEGPNERRFQHVRRPGMLRSADSPGLSAFARPILRRRSKDTQDGAGPLRPSSPAGVINIAPTAVSVASRASGSGGPGLQGTGGEDRRARGDSPVAAGSEHDLDAAFGKLVELRSAALFVQGA